MEPRLRQQSHETRQRNQKQLRVRGMARRTAWQGQVNSGPLGSGPAGRPSSLHRRPARPCLYRTPHVRDGRGEGMPPSGTRTKTSPLRRARLSLCSFPHPPTVLLAGGPVGSLSLSPAPLLAVMIGFSSLHCRLALTAGDGLDFVCYAPMHTVKVSREKDVDLLFAGLKRNSEAVTRIGARLVLQQQPAAPA